MSGWRAQVEVDVEGFDDYRRLFAALLEAARSVNARVYTLQYFANRASYSGRQWLNGLIDGSRDLNARGYEGALRAFDLSPAEASHLALLMTLAHGTDLEKTRARELLALRRRVRREGGVGAEAERYLASWFQPVIREMALLAGFRKRVDWVRRRLRVDVPVDAVADAMRWLVREKLWGESEAGRRLSADDWYAAGHESPGAAARAYHQAMLAQASASIDTVERNERHINGVTVALPARHLPALKERLNLLIEEIGAEAQRLHRDAPETVDTVYQVEVAVFPHTRSPR